MLASLDPSTVSHPIEQSASGSEGRITFEAKPRAENVLHTQNVVIIENMKRTINHSEISQSSQAVKSSMPSHSSKGLTPDGNTMLLEPPDGNTMMLEPPDGNPMTLESPEGTLVCTGMSVC